LKPSSFNWSAICLARFSRSYLIFAATLLVVGALLLARVLLFQAHRIALQLVVQTGGSIRRK